MAAKIAVAAQKISRLENMTCQRGAAREVALNLRQVSVRQAAIHPANVTQIMTAMAATITAIQNHS